MLSTREAISRLIFIEHQLSAVDLVMVLGCNSVSSMEPAISLYEARLAPLILISGCGPSERSEPEWKVLREYALKKGIPPSAILIEPRARNTRENFLFSEVLLASDPGWAQISTLALATSPLHSRRALMTARKYFPSGLEIRVHSPSSDAELRSSNWWMTSKGRRLVLDEVRKIGEYAICGDLSDY